MTKKRKLLRYFSALLLGILLCMVWGGTYHIDFKGRPLFFTFYFLGAIALGVVVISLTLWEIWEFHKELRQSLIEDQKQMVQLLKYSISKEKQNRGGAGGHKREEEKD